MQSLKGGAGTPKRTPVPRVPRAQKQATIHAAENLLAPWEVNQPPPVPKPKVPRSVVVINKPATVPSGRSAVRQENNRYKAALAGPLNVPIKVNGKTVKSHDYLAQTMPVQRRNEYNRLLERTATTAPPDDTSLLHALASMPGSILHEYGVGAHVAGRAGAGLLHAIGDPIAREAIEGAYAPQPTGPLAPPVPPPSVRAAAAGGAAAVHEGLAFQYGRSLTNLATTGHTSDVPGALVEAGLAALPLHGALSDVLEGAGKAELGDAAFNLKRALTPEEAAHNLRYVEGGDLYNPARGVQRNGKVFRTVNGVKRVLVIGKPTPQQWVKRVVAAIPSAEERNVLAKWYQEVAPTFVRFFGSDAEEILRGFAVSQANASPTSGIGAVLRVLDKIKAGETPAPDEISAVVDSITAAVQHEHVSRGLAAKLHDFADSLEGKTTRTWMGDDPRGGAPTANDIHAIRDHGYVDAKLAARLRTPEEDALFKHGIDNFVIDSGGSPTDHQYERMREGYQQITDYLNETHFDGRTDWEPREVQALGWSAIQRVHGAHPENLVDAVTNNTRRISLEVTKGISGIGKDLTLAESTRVAQAVAEPIRALVESFPAVYMSSGIQTGVSAYKGEANAVLHFEIIASPEKTHDIVSRLADALDHPDVWATRASSSTGAKPTLVIAHDALADPETMLALHEALYAADQKKFASFVDSELNGMPAIEIVMRGKAVTKAEADARWHELGDTINAAVDKVLGDVEYHSVLRNTQVIDKGWKSGKGRISRVAGTEAQRTLADSHSAEVRRRLEEAVAAERQAPEVGLQAAYRGLHTAPEREAGMSFDNPSNVFGEDVYGPNALRFFGSGGPSRAQDAATQAWARRMQNADKESLAALKAARGNPDHELTVYRAVPKDAPDVVNPGDWVSPSRTYAEIHGESNLEAPGGGYDQPSEYKIVSRQVRAGDLHTDGDLNEWGWTPPGSLLQRLLSEEGGGGAPFALLGRRAEHKAAEAEAEKAAADAAKTERETSIKAAAHDYEGWLQRYPTADEQLKSEMMSQIAQRNGIDLYGLRRYVLDGVLTEATSPAHEVSLLYGSMKAARGKQEASFSAERGTKFAQSRAAYEKAGGGIEGHYAALRAMRGQLTKLEWGRFREINEESIAAMIAEIHDHPGLMQGQKLTAAESVMRAVSEGRSPSFGEIKLLEKVFPPQVVKNFVANVPLLKKAWNTGVELINVPRALMSSVDLSAPLRQGLMIGARFPLMAIKSLPPMARMAFSERYFTEVEARILADPDYERALEDGLSLTDFEHPGFAHKEEAYLGKNIAERLNIRTIPGLKWTGKYGTGPGDLVRGSARAYVGYLNLIRMQAYKNLIRSAEAEGLNLDAATRSAWVRHGPTTLGDETIGGSIARFVNSASGRGSLGAFNDHLATMNALFFSPRLLASRLNFMNPVYYASLDPFARKQALRSAFQLLGTVAAVLGVAELAGGKVEWNPDNADFGKIKVGNTRFDILGGFQQPVRLLAQLVTGKVISSTTGKTLRLGPQGPGKLSERDIIERFAESKLAPVPSTINDKLAGTNYLGQKFSWGQEAYQHLTPLLLQDTYDLYKEDPRTMTGLAKAFGGYGIGVLGLGEQTYGPKPAKSGPSLVVPRSGGLLGGGGAGSPSGLLGGGGGSRPSGLLGGGGGSKSSALLGG